MLKAIDIHCHFNHGAKFDNKVSDNYIASLEFLKAERLRLNIPICAMAGTFSSVLSSENVVEENEYLYNLSLSDDFIYQWVVVDPHQEETFKQAEKMLKSKKCLGIKIHPENHGYIFYNYQDKILSFASNYNAVVLMHPSCSNDLKVMDNYPNVKLIVAHLGTVDNYYVSVIKNAKHQNIYTDTSGSASIKNNVIERTVKEVGSQKILFGTDSYSSAFQLGRIEFANISTIDKENILYKNALKLFPNLKV